MTLAARPEDLLREFPDFSFDEVAWEPRYNVAPGQDVLVLPQDGRARFLRWGLVPSWAPDPSVGSRMINARAETVRERPAFRSAFRRRRCLVPVDGFYEWRGEAGHRQPYHVALEGGHLFALAGLWERWSPREGEALETFTVLTTEANDSVRPLHDRMPAILPARAREAWLDPGTPPEALQALLVPYPAGLVVRPVSRYVNSAWHEGPECLAAPDP